MVNQEQAVLVYLELALVSALKGQFDGRDRFLGLAGIASCRAGMLKVGDRCFQLILAHNSRHLLHRYSGFPQALQDPDFRSFELSLERFCSFEHAEYLLEQQPRQLQTSGTVDEQADQLLRGVEALKPG